MIPSSKSLCYISVITLGASRLASAGLEHVIGDSEITTKQALTRHSPHDLNPALGNVAAEEVGKGYGHNRQIGLKGMSQSLSGKQAKMNSIRSDWDIIDGNISIFTWAYGKSEDDMMEYVEKLTLLKAFLGKKSGEMARGLPGHLPEDIPGRASAFEDTWSELEKTLSDANGAIKDDFKIGLIEIMLMSAGHMTKYQLMPPEFLAGIQILQPMNLSRLLQFYLTRKPWNSGRVLNHLDWNSVVPTLECLANHKMLVVFRGPIRALDDTGKKQIVKDSLETFLMASKENLQTGSDDNAQFMTSMKPFFEKNLDAGVSLSATGRPSATGMEEQMMIKNVEDQKDILKILQHAVKQIENPPHISEGEKARNTFLFSCYLIKFFQDFYPDMMVKTSPEIINLNSSEFVRKNELIRETFKMLHNPNEYNRHTMNLRYIQIIKGKGYDQDMMVWVKKVTALLFGEEKMKDIKILLERIPSHIHPFPE
ncbi:hypothetical protein MJO28_011855 [Puccinia striiformis f. sp. tritici]|uniref:Uncharacterized protein n=1 Tax=Puccinia striiformis f. sp. tritici TaxID=168172 RepID=A0ACC0E3S8_9BASI|nr:hypothetical protein MJO28_011855 [Puccinia striiformis f. sp. tritici]